MGNFFKNVIHVFTKLFGNAPSVLQTASSVLRYVSPFIKGILSLVGGEPLAADVQKIVAEIQSDLATAATLISQSHGSPSAGIVDQLVNILTAVNSNLAALLQAGHIKEPSTVAKVTAIVNTITGEIQALVGFLQPNTGGANNASTAKAFTPTA